MIWKAGCLNWGISAVSLAPDTKMRHANLGIFQKVQGSQPDYPGLSPRV